MHIVVKEKEGKRMNIRIPNCLALNAITAKIGETAIKKTAGKSGVVITAAQLRHLFRELKRSHHLLRERDLHLVEVSEKGGDYVLVDF